MEQDKIDLTRALPASPPPTARRTVLASALVSLIVVAAAAVACSSSSSPVPAGILSRVGITLPAAEVAHRAPPQGGAAAGGGPPGAQAGGGPGGFGGGVAAGVGRWSLHPPSSATINDKLTAIGEGSAVNSVSVVAPAGGTLMEVLVKPGDRVAAGDKLAELDSQSQQIAFDRATLAAARRRAGTGPRERAAPRTIHSRASSWRRPS